MTAVNAIASGSRGRMVVDSASYSPDGEVDGFVAKAVALPHLGMVFASRGATAARWVFAEELEAFASFDAVVTGGAEVLHQAHQAEAFHGEFDLMLMGWSEARRRVELYTLSSLSHPGLTAFSFHRMRVSLAPMPAEDALRRIGLKVGSMWDTSGPEAKLLEVIELQRSTPAALLASVDAPARSYVGGAAVLTEVSEAGITQRVVRRWPSVIGQRLASDDAPSPTTTAAPPLRVVA